MEIHINRKIIILVAAFVALVFGAVTLFLGSNGAGQADTDSNIGSRTTTSSRFTSSPSAAGNDPAEVTLAFAKAFYTVDYADYDGWLSGLKVVSTSDGYAILTKSIVPAVWPEIEKAKTVTPAEAVEASDAGLVLEGDSQIGGPWQIRNVSVHIDPARLWPTMKSGDFTAMVMLAQQDGQWRFVSFMTPDQIEQIKKGQQP